MPEARINVEGTAYVLPTLDTLNLREWRILKRYSDLTIDQIMEVAGLDPGVMGGMLAIAIHRSDPSLRDQEVDAMAEGMNGYDMMEQLFAIAEATPDPTPAEAPLPESDSKTSSDEQTLSSGAVGDGDSEHSQETLSPASTGSPASV